MHWSTRTLRWRRGIVASAVVVASSGGVARANDSSFGGAGADLVPLSDQQVEMRSEEIRLTPGVGQGWETDWAIEASYVFFNTASTPVTVQVGFPEFRCEADENVDCANVAFQGLETRVDGTLVKHRKGKLGKRHGWEDFVGQVWLFDVTFPPGKPVGIQHRYRVRSGANVQGDFYTSYMTRTGRSWKGPIGHATFTCVLPPYVRAVYGYSVKGLTAKPPRIIQNDGTPRLELVVEGNDWKPEGGVGFAFNDNSPLRPLATRNVKEEGLFPMGPGCDPGADLSDAQRCLNELYASKGYPFKGEALRKKYYSGNPSFVWHEIEDYKLWLRDPGPLESFSPSWFSAGEKQQIQRWSERVGRANSAPAELEPSALLAPKAATSSPPPSSTGPEPASSPTAIGRSGAPEPAAAANERLNRAEPVAAASSAPTAPPSAPTAPPSAPTAPPSAPAVAAGGCHLPPGPATAPEHAVALLVVAAALHAWRRGRECSKRA